MAPRLIQDRLENFSGRCWPRSPREIVFLQKISTKNLPDWVHRRPFRQTLAGIFGNFKLLVFPLSPVSVLQTLNQEQHSGGRAGVFCFFSPRHSVLQSTTLGRFFFFCYPPILDYLTAYSRKWLAYSFNCILRSIP